MKTKKMIKILPLEADLKKELLESFDDLSTDKKNRIQRMLWAAYDALYQIKLQNNLRIAFDEVGRGQEDLNKDFYSRVKKLTDDEMNQVSLEDEKALDLEITREKLAEIIADK